MTLSTGDLLAKVKIVDGQLLLISSESHRTFKVIESGRYDYTDGKTYVSGVKVEVLE